MLCRACVIGGRHPIPFATITGDLLADGYGFAPKACVTTSRVLKINEVSRGATSAPLLFVSPSATSGKRIIFRFADEKHSNE